MNTIKSAILKYACRTITKDLLKEQSGMSDFYNDNSCNACLAGVKPTEEEIQIETNNRKGIEIKINVFEEIAKNYL